MSPSRHGYYHDTPCRIAYPFSCSITTDDPHFYEHNGGANYPKAIVDISIFRFVARLGDTIYQAEFLPSGRGEGEIIKRLMFQSCMEESTGLAPICILRANALFLFVPRFSFYTMILSFISASSTCDKNEPTVNHG